MEGGQTALHSVHNNTQRQPSGPGSAPACGLAVCAPSSTESARCQIAERSRTVEIGDHRCCAPKLHDWHVCMHCSKKAGCTARRYIRLLQLLQVPPFGQGTCHVSFRPPDDLRKKRASTGKERMFRLSAGVALHTVQRNTICTPVHPNMRK